MTIESEISPFQPAEKLTPKERLGNQSICVATTTFYKKWRAGEEKARTADQIRGNLAIMTIRSALNNGYQVVVIDRGSSQAFKNELAKLGIQVIDQTEEGMSGSRRQAFRTAAELEGVEIICWTEPEKISMVENLWIAVKPILEGKADIVIPCRTEKSYDTYPPKQAVSEKSANFWANEVLRIIGLLSRNAPDLDLFFGPRIFRRKGVLKFFLESYKLNPDSRLKGKVRPEAYLNATFFPIMAALIKGLRVIGVPINYTHPPEQTNFEEETPEFEEKRRKQKTDIVRGMVQLARLLINNPEKPSELLKETE